MCRGEPSRREPAAPGEYAGFAAGEVLSSVTGLYPWVGYQATERITVWGVGGVGGSGVLLTPEGGPGASR